MWRGPTSSSFKDLVFLMDANGKCWTVFGLFRALLFTGLVSMWRALFV